jgi:hypothetical protein
MLFEGNHKRYFLDEGRTSFNFPEAEVDGRRIRPYATFNLLKLVSVKTADLLFGAKPKIEAPTPAQKDAIDELSRRSLLPSRLHAAAVQFSWAGGAFLESTLWRDGLPYVELVQADEMFPQGKLQPDGQYDSYVRYATDQIPGPTADAKPTTLLLKTIYAPGVIRRELYQLDEKGAIDKKDLPLDQWPAFAGPAGTPAPEPEQRTGVDDNTISYLPNEVGGQLELPDFDGLISLQDAANAKFAQVWRVLAKHADPKFAAPETSVDADGNIRSTADVWFFRSKDEIPQYITWSAELAAAMADRDAAVDALCVAAEMSQVILGIKRGGGVPDSARKLRLEATNSLAKVGRKALIIEPAIARAVETALRLRGSAVQRVFSRAPALDTPQDPVGVSVRDGMPVDELDTASTAAAWRGAGLMSVEDGVAMRLQDPDAEATEVKRIKDEISNATPSVLLQRPDANPAPASPISSSSSSSKERPREEVEAARFLRDEPGAGVSFGARASRPREAPR